MSEQPLAAPAPTPPGDLTTKPIWTSPTTYIALAGFFTPLLTVLFGDVSKQTTTVCQAIAGLATIAWIISRSVAWRTVVNGNVELAKLRASIESDQASRALHAAIAAAPKSGDIDVANKTLFEDHIVPMALRLQDVEDKLAKNGIGFDNAKPAKPTNVDPEAVSAPSLADVDAETADSTEVPSEDAIAAAAAKKAARRARRLYKEGNVELAIDGELQVVPIPRTPKGTIDGRTKAGKAALALGISE